MEGSDNIVLFSGLILIFHYKDIFLQFSLNIFGCFVLYISHTKPNFLRSGMFLILKSSSASLSNGLSLCEEAYTIYCILPNDPTNQGYNARQVISEVYASFVLQCTVSGS